LRNNYRSVFQVAAVFIGTIVGAGLASGQEIAQFFTVYGISSFVGIILCAFIYIVVGTYIIKVSIKFNFKSYSELIQCICPGFIGKAINFLTGLFLISSSSVILAGSGALIHQYFGISNWYGIILMISASLPVILRNTKGLIEINSFIVPALIIIIVLIFILYIMFSGNVSFNYLNNINPVKKNWLLSSIIYGCFNLLCCTGVLVPLSSEIKNSKTLVVGLAAGALGLTILSLVINLLLMLNIPYIFHYEIPMLYISNRFGTIMQIILLCIIWLEMFSTEVSNVFSISRALENTTGLSYKLCSVIVLLTAIPISQIGFKNLILLLYPGFAVISFIFIIQCIIFSYKNNSL
jgi:uncharacterized membrane protein YkvI